MSTRSTDLSRRTRTLLLLFRAAALIFLAAAVGLIASLIGSLAFSWEDAPVPQMGVAIVYAAIAIMTLRVALAWSASRDARRKR